MAAATATLKWVDVLEAQFDKSWVDMDQLLKQVDEEEDLQELSSLCRRHASSLASCFSQLVHKSSVVYQNNAKLEAELINIREEMTLQRTQLDQVKKDKEYLITILQSALIENHQLKNQNPVDKDALFYEIVSRLERREKRSLNVSKDYYSSERLFSENSGLRREIFELESELVGARMDNVYVDKELAGRIQQIQLLAAGTPAEVKERLWSQIESEMCLQRAKTIAQICQTRQELRNKRLQSLNKEKQSSNETKQDFGNGQATEDITHAKGKQVMVLKNPADDLGIGIIGGSEHNLPIIVSEIFPNSAVFRSKKLKAGDIILAVNGVDFNDVSRPEAVAFLSSLRGQITFELQAAETVSEDDPSNLDFRFYRIFEPVARPSETGSPRNRSEICTPPGRAVMSFSSVDGSSPKIRLDSQDIIPPVHYSPRREIPPPFPGVDVPSSEKSNDKFMTEKDTSLVSKILSQKISDDTDTNKVVERKINLASDSKIEHV